MIRNRAELATTPDRATALDCLAAGIAAADPERAVRERVSLDGDRLEVAGETLDLDAFEEVIVVGAGKAVVGLARGLEAVLEGRLSGGIVVADQAADLDRVTVAVGDHPVPTERGVAAAERLAGVVDDASEDTLILAGITGGGSSLLSVPATGVTLADLRATTEALLGAGRDVAAINAVRKHLSALTGGRLAVRAAPAKVRCLLVSDVVGDDPGVIASGPFSPDPTTYGEALAACEDLAVPRPVRDYLARGAAGELPETPEHGHDAFDRVNTAVLVNGETAIDAAAEAARAAGAAVTVLDRAATGEARDAAERHLAAARRIRRGEGEVTPPAAMLSGGELTVTVRGGGEGGPNQEFCLAAALRCPAGVTVAAVDTDGLDGSTDAAGAIVDETTVDDDELARAALVDNDARPYLDKRNALVRTGRTGTNVNDLRVVIVG